MSESAAGALLRLESDVLLAKAANEGTPRELFVSVNPDLVTDFGHYLNYEKRLAEACRMRGLDHLCLASRQLTLHIPGIVGTFERDSGHYAMVRRSAFGREDAIAAEFQAALLAALTELAHGASYQRLHIFMYCGSSRLAMRLAERTWPADLNLCINAFWDFMIDDPAPAGLSRLHFQRNVHLLAMSDLHARRWQEDCGLHFEAIPNPPPLLSDRGAYNAIRECVSSTRKPGPLRVFVPGLLSMGKGRESTQALLDHLYRHGAGGCEYTFRDRKGELNTGDAPHVRILTGDLSDSQVVDLYQASDVVLLPYEREVFAVRTSGALVDALVFGTVPLVLEGTWLAHQCRLCEVGEVLPDAQPETVVEALATICSDIAQARRRVSRAAALYLAENTWSRLLERVTRRGDCDDQPAAAEQTGDAAVSLFAAANRMLRERQFASAAQLYIWLQSAVPLSIYATNLDLCARYSGQSIDELLSNHL